VKCESLDSFALRSRTPIGVNCILGCLSSLLCQFDLIDLSSLARKSILGAKVGIPYQIHRHLSEVHNLHAVREPLTRARATACKSQILMARSSEVVANICPSLGNSMSFTGLACPNGLDCISTPNYEVLAIRSESNSLRTSFLSGLYLYST